MTIGMIRKLKLVQLNEKAAHAVRIIKSVEKNISKSENALKKRISELDKVREKIAQLQAQDS